MLPRSLIYNPPEKQYKEGSEEWYQLMAIRVNAELGLDAIEKERHSLLYGRIVANGRFKKH